MGKRSFVRGVFGDTINFGSRTRLSCEIELVLSNKYQIDYVVYVFGEDNEKYLQDIGLKTRLIDKRNWVWERSTELFRHKLEFYKMGMEEFEEIVYLDWDVLQARPLPLNYWENLHKKEVIQGNLYWKRGVQSYWKKLSGTQGLLINAGILPLRDKTFPNLLIKTWDEMNNGISLKNNTEIEFWQRWKYNDEVVMQYVIDNKYNLCEKDMPSFIDE
jgi:hypothetical protein